LHTADLSSPVLFLGYEKAAVCATLFTKVEQEQSFS
jgi:hypothetical protein